MHPSRARTTSRLAPPDAATWEVVFYPLGGAAEVWAFEARVYIAS